MNKVRLSLRHILIYLGDAAIFIVLIAMQDLDIAVLDSAYRRVLVLTLIDGILLRLFQRFIFFLLAQKPVTNVRRTVLDGRSLRREVTFGALVQLVRRRFAADDLARLLLYQFDLFFLAVGRNCRHGAL